LKAKLFKWILEHSSHITEIYRKITLTEKLFDNVRKYYSFISANCPPSCLYIIQIPKSS